MVMTITTMGRREVVIAVATVAAASAAVLLLRHWQQSSERRWKRTQRLLRKLASECATPVPKLWKLADELVDDMQTALSNVHSLTDGTSTTTAAKKCKLPMLISHVDNFPSGKEEGVYYGVNLSPIELRASRIQLGGKEAGIVKQESQTITVPSNVTVHFSSEDLFNFIAMELATFVSKERESFGVLPERKKKIGFTYSFPIEQDAISNSNNNVIKWKSFSVDDAEGRGMVEKLNKALELHNVDMRVATTVDETVGNLIGDRYYNKDVVAAITLAMGSNAAYVEKAIAVPKWQGEAPKSGEMVIDVKWGNFNSSLFALTEYDVQLDAESCNPGEQIYEKLISGMYLGEIVRIVLLKMAKQTALFGESIPPKLKTPYILRSPDMAAMHQDTSDNREVVGEKLKEIFGISDTTPMVREVVADVCDIIVERGARLAGAGILGILKKVGRIETKEKCVVTVEGGLYQHYRLYRNYLNSGIWEMLGSDYSDSVVIENSNGGSGMGAVFLAASKSHSI